MSVEKINTNHFFVRANDGDTRFYGYIKRESVHRWAATIYEKDGTFHRCTGIWSTKKGVIDEVMCFIDSDYRIARLVP